VTAARAQTRTAFEAVASLTRAAAIDYAAGQPSLNEDMLVATPNAAAVAAWNGLFDPIEAYAAHLSGLASGGAAGRVETALGGLAQQFNTTSSHLEKAAAVGSGGQIAAGPASALADIAGALLRARGAKEASEIALGVDPQIRAFFAALAGAIGADATSGLRGTVWSNWNQRLIVITQEFLDAGTAEKRKPVVEKYVALVEKRAAQDEQLASLRGTYLALADAHSALARQNQDELRAAIDFIGGELKHARELQAEFQKTLPR
jgi:hypothetical protein